MGGVGKVLGFQTEAGVLAVHRTWFAGNAGEHIARIKLNAGLGGRYLHRSAAARFKNFGAGAEFSRIAVNRKAMVVTFLPVPQNGLAFSEIKGGVVDGNQAAGRDEVFINLNI